MKNVDMMNDKNIMVIVHDQNMGWIHLDRILNLSKQSKSLIKYLPSMRQKIIMIQIPIRTKGPAGINIFKFDSAREHH
jgi:hypothetical protein